MEEYAEIKISVKAQACDINGPNQLELDEAIDILIEQLRMWLKGKTRSGGFQLEFDVQEEW